MNRLLEVALADARGEAEAGARGGGGQRVSPRGGHRRRRGRRRRLRRGSAGRRGSAQALSGRQALEGADVRSVLSGLDRQVPYLQVSSRRGVCKSIIEYLLIVNELSVIKTGSGRWRAGA